MSPIGVSARLQIAFWLPISFDRSFEHYGVEIDWITTDIRFNINVLLECTEGDNTRMEGRF